MWNGGGVACVRKPVERMRERSSSGLGAVCSSVLMRVWRNWAEVAEWWWCVVDEACGVLSVSVSAEVVVVFACVFFWGASAGMFFSFPTSFLLEFRSFPSYPIKRHFTTYVTCGLCGFMNVETRG